MIEIKKDGWMPIELMEVVKELRRKGYVQGTDFDFSYHRPNFNDTTYELVNDRYAIFKFYKDELATWFELVYG